MNQPHDWRRYPFQLVPADRQLDFPAAEANHPDCESDTWFLAGELTGESGRGYAFLSIFNKNRPGLGDIVADFYTFALFDLDAGPVTVTLPDAGERFMSMQVVNEDHYVPEVNYGAGSYTLDKEKVGTRYVVVAIRTLVDPADPEDVKEVHALQDAIKVEQASAGAFETPDWDQASQKTVRDALLVLQSTLPDFRKAFGTKDDVDPIRHLLGTAAGWGGNPDKDATYLNITPANNDGTTVYRLNVQDVPVDGFWSVSLYDAEGYYEKNEYNAYSINNITAKKSEDGAIDIQFGGCDGKVPNCLPIMKGWNYTVRLYRPREEILNGTWKFPEPQPAG